MEQEVPKDLRMKWLNAERLACECISSPERQQSDLAHSIITIRNEDRIPTSLNAYCDLWIAYFDLQPQGAIHACQAREKWLSMAQSPEKDEHDRAWWYHCAVIAGKLEMIKQAHKKDVKEGFDLLLASAIRVLGECLATNSVMRDSTVSSTFGVILSEFMLLRNAEYDVVEQELKRYWPNDKVKESLQMEFSAMKQVCVSKGQNPNMAGENLRLAAKKHCLFAHQLRCLMLAEHFSELAANA